MVRCAVGMAAEMFGPELAGERQDGGGFERRRLRHRRQQSGQAAGEHRLAGTGRAGKEE